MISKEDLGAVVHFPQWPSEDVYEKPVLYVPRQDAALWGYPPHPLIGYVAAKKWAFHTIADLMPWGTLARLIVPDEEYPDSYTFVLVPWAWVRQVVSLKEVQIPGAKEVRMSKSRVLKVDVGKKCLHRALGIGPEWEEQADAVADIVANADTMAEVLAKLWELDWPLEAKVYWTHHIGFACGMCHGKREIAEALAELVSLVRDTADALEETDVS